MKSGAPCLCKWASFLEHLVHRQSTTPQGRGVNASWCECGVSLKVLDVCVAQAVPRHWRRVADPADVLAGQGAPPLTARKKRWKREGREQARKEGEEP